MARQMSEEVRDRLADLLIDIALRVSLRLKFGLGNDERVIAAVDHMQMRLRAHLVANVIEQIERAKFVARALYKQHWRFQIDQDLIAQFCAITHAAKRISETDKACDLLLQGEMAADAPTHALADKHDRSRVLADKTFERQSVCGDELGQRIRALPASKHVGIVEGFDRSQRRQHLREFLHARVRARSAGAWGEQERKDVWGHGSTLGSQERLATVLLADQV